MRIYIRTTIVQAVSLSYGGTNAHVIVESADSLLALKQFYQYRNLMAGPARSPRGALERRRPYLLPFSAHEAPALERNIFAHLQIMENYKLHDLTYTLSNRRSTFNNRGFTVVSHDGLDTLCEHKLAAFTTGTAKRNPTLGFIFTGQGAQWARMGSDLMTYYPSFLRTIRVLDAILGDLEDAPEWTIEDSLRVTTDDEFVHEAEFAQPLCTAVQIALVNLLLAWNIMPVVTIGHSSGEIAAAYAAGHISASDAILLAYYRGQVVKSINTNGTMCAVGLGAEEVQPYLSKSNGRVIVACHNSPSSVTLSGDEPAVKELYDDLTIRKVFARMVKTRGKAYHSPHMAPAAAKYEAMVRKAKAEMLPFDIPLLSTAKMVSSVTNSVLDKGIILDPSYFSANLRQSVLFNQAMSTALGSPEFANVDILVEVGPHGALSSSVRQIRTTLGASRLTYLPFLARGAKCAAQMLKLAVEKAEQSGKIVHKRGNLVVDLPGYRWGNKVYWAENRQSAEHRRPAYPRHDLLGAIVPGSSLSEPTWRNVLRVRDVPWLADHTLGGEAIYPAAAYFSMAMEAITQIQEHSKDTKAITGYEFRDVSMKQALVSPDDEDGIEVLFNMRPAMYSDAGAGSYWWDFNVSSVDREGTRKDHMSGTISASSATTKLIPRPMPNLLQRASGKGWNQALVGTAISSRFR